MSECPIEKGARSLCDTRIGHSRSHFAVRSVQNHCRNPSFGCDHLLRNLAAAQVVIASKSAPFRQCYECELDARHTVGRCLKNNVGREPVGKLDQRVNCIHDFGPASRTSIVVRFDQRQPTILRTQSIVEMLRNSCMVASMLRHRLANMAMEPISGSGGVIRCSTVSRTEEICSRRMEIVVAK